MADEQVRGRDHAAQLLVGLRKGRHDQVTNHRFVPLRRVHDSRDGAAICGIDFRANRGELKSFLRRWPVKYAGVVGERGRAPEGLRRADAWAGDSSGAREGTPQASG
jgi:hypothetical protein